MSFKEIKDTFYEFTQKFSVKTEEYAKIAKLNLDIKKIEADNSKSYKELGKEVYQLKISGVTELPFKGTNVNDICERISESLIKIENKREEIEEIRKIAHIKESEISAQSDRYSASDDSDDNDI